MKKFSLKISRQIDKLHVEMEKVKHQHLTPEAKVDKMLVLRNELRALERKVKV